MDHLSPRRLLAAPVGSGSSLCYTVSLDSHWYCDSGPHNRVFGGEGDYMSEVGGDWQMTRVFFLFVLFPWIDFHVDFCL